MTVLEASEYYHIGENKLRNVIDSHPNAEFLIMNGNRYLIKKKKFEEYLECATLLQEKGEKVHKKSPVCARI